MNETYLNVLVATSLFAMREVTAETRKAKNNDDTNRHSRVKYSSNTCRAKGNMHQVS